MIERTMWHIWSNEHRGWWGPNGCGYVKNRLEAGVYPYTEAAQICQSANTFLAQDQEPNETMLPVNE
jgi:hypothetical protein